MILTKGEAMDVARAIEGTFERGDEARFTGEVWLRSTLGDDAGTTVAVVHFAPDARTRWHRHPTGQFLYAVSGRGRVRTREEAGHVLEAGDVIHVGPEEWHFHGGSRTAPMVHVAVTGGAVEWGDPVTEGEFDEGFTSP
jgi:quercetin dioxygenase-like cupin family protein